MTRPRWVDMQTSPHPDVLPSYKRPGWMSNSCPVMERTGDGVRVGRCYFHLGADRRTCPRHGRIAFEGEDGQAPSTADS